VQGDVLYPPVMLKVILKQTVTSDI